VGGFCRRASAWLVKGESNLQQVAGFFPFARGA
jgi:hypothetical protein